MKKKLGLLLVAIPLLAQPAHATASLSCEVDDTSMALTISGVISRGLGARIMNFAAEGKLKAPGVADDLRALKYEQEHLVHTWLDGKDLKLLVYREREGNRHGYVQITIETKLKPKSDGEYRGRYVAEVHDLPEGASEGKTTKLRGAITCSAE